MTGSRQWVILLLAALLVLVGYLGRRKVREETVRAVEQSATEASAALAWKAEAATAEDEDATAEVQADIEAAAASAVDQAGPQAALAEDLCVQDIVKDATARLEADPDFPGQRTEREALEDVDLDGEPEDLVSFRELCGARNCSWAIYATNGGCSRYVGILEGSGWTVLRSFRHDHRDIATTWVLGCAGAERYEAVLEYDGLQYLETSSEYMNECPPGES